MVGTRDSGLRLTDRGRRWEDETGSSWGYRKRALGDNKQCEGRGSVGGKRDGRAGAGKDRFWKLGLKVANRPRNYRPQGCQLGYDCLSCIASDASF